MVPQRTINIARQYCQENRQQNCIWIWLDPSRRASFGKPITSGTGAAALSREFAGMGHAFEGNAGTGIPRAIATLYTCYITQGWWGFLFWDPAGKGGPMGDLQVFPLRIGSGFRWGPPTNSRQRSSLFLRCSVLQWSTWVNWFNHYFTELD